MQKAKFFLLLLLLPCYGQVWAQAGKSKLDQADKLFSKGEVDKALSMYLQLEKEQPEDARIQFRLGVAHLSTYTKFSALPHLEKAFTANPEVDADIHYYLGTAHQLHSHFNRAKRHFEEYKKKNKRFTAIANHKIQECELGDSLMRNPVLCVIKVLEWPVNSPFQDYGSVLNHDETKLFFTSARDTTKTDFRYKNTFFEDILFSQKRNGTWSVPEKVSAVNDEYHDAVTYLSPDGRSMLLYYERER